MKTTFVPVHILAGGLLFAVLGMSACGHDEPVAPAPQLGPIVQISIYGLGPRTFEPGSAMLTVVVPAGRRPIGSFRCLPARDGTPVAARRFGWDIRDLSNDEEWEQSWSATSGNWIPRVFQSGTHLFSVEARDTAGRITLAQVQVLVKAAAF